MRRSGAGYRAPSSRVTRMRFRNESGQVKYALAVWSVTKFGAGYLPVGASFWDGTPNWTVVLGTNQYGEQIGYGSGVVLPDSTILPSLPHELAHLIPQNSTPLSTKEVDTLRNDVQSLSAKCKEFLASIISELGRLPYSSWDPIKPYTTDVVKIFGDIEAAGGFHRKALGGKAYALTNPNSLTTYIDEKYFTSLSREDGFASTQRGVGIGHELVHAAAGRGFAYSHDAMAQAAYNVSLANGHQNVRAIPMVRDFPNTLAGREEYDRALSNYFDARVAQACF